MLRNSQLGGPFKRVIQDGSIEVSKVDSAFQIMGSTCFVKRQRRKLVFKP